MDNFHVGSTEYYSTTEGAYAMKAIHDTPNPRPPMPELAFADTEYGMAYAWKLVYKGIISIENTKAECLNQWHESYQRERAEYGPQGWQA
jgi:hypothetical protein